MCLGKWQTSTLITLNTLDSTCRITQIKILHSFLMMDSSSLVRTLSLFPNDVANHHESESIRRKNQKVLVHCVQGISRSSTLVSAYLMRHKGWGAEQALEHLQRVRPIICPNDGFRLQLKQFEMSLSPVETQLRITNGVKRLSITDSDESKSNKDSKKSS